MMKNAIVTVKGTQIVDGNEEILELTSEARYGIKDGEILISYDESELLGVKEVKTMLRCKLPDTVIIKRSGAIESRLVIQKDKTNSCLYNTGYGELLLDITGREFRQCLDENGGSLYMSYDIDVNGKILSENIIEITVMLERKE